jgi:cyanophycinase
VLAGGDVQHPDIVRRFLEHAGGSTARIIVIPTAQAADQFDDEYEGLERFRRAGATDVAILHTRSRTTADSEAFVQVLDDADGVWFSGGRQWRLADAYLGTRTEEALLRLLGRGGVVGGSSAGATILGSFLVRGDADGNALMIGDHRDGFGFLKRTAVDQHLLRRNRHFDLIEVVEAHPELLGVGIDEDTAIIVQGDTFEVVGSGYVAIYDFNTQLRGGGRFYFLSPGDRFDLAGREATRGEGDGHALEGLESRPWHP